MALTKHEKLARGIKSILNELDVFYEQVAKISNVLQLHFYTTSIIVGRPLMADREIRAMMYTHLCGIKRFSPNEELRRAAENSLVLNLVFAESIRLFTPAYMAVRRPTAPLICRGKDKEGNVVFEEKIKKNEVLATAFTFAGRSLSRFEKPDEFNPRRFSKVPSLDWEPFGDGAHTCPGQWLAKSEILIFVAALVKQFRFVSFPEKEPEQKGFTTIKTPEDIWVSLSSRI